MAIPSIRPPLPEAPAERPEFRSFLEKLDRFSREVDSRDRPRGQDPARVIRAADMDDAE